MDLRSPGMLVTLLPLLGVAAFVVERLVVTDAEAVEARIEAAAEAADRRDFEALRAYLSRDFSADGRDREAFADWVERQVRAGDPRGIEVDLDEVTVGEGEARVRGELRFGAWGRTLHAKFEARLVLEEDEWRIVSAREAPGGRFHGLDPFGR